MMLLMKGGIVDDSLMWMVTNILIVGYSVTETATKLAYNSTKKLNTFTKLS